MSIKRRIQYQYRNLLNGLWSLRLPAWAVARVTKVVLVVVIVGFGSAYIARTASSATAGYELNSLENQIHDLSGQIEWLEVEIADRSSILSIQERLADSDMIAVTDLKFHAPTDRVAAN